MMKDDPSKEPNPGIVEEGNRAVFSVGGKRLSRRDFMMMSGMSAASLTIPAKAAPHADLGGNITVKDFGAAGDGIHDDTAAIQLSIDTAATTGDRVILPAGKYLVTDGLKVRAGVAIEGAANSPRYNSPLTGTVILAKVGRDNEDGPPLFELVDSTSVSGITVYYPDQKAKDIHPYSWTFNLINNDNTVENVTLINSYNGIQVGNGTAWNVRHRIRSVYGCVLRRGIYVDGCSDVGRIENVHFHGQWWWSREVGGVPDNSDGTLGLVNQYLKDNLEAFTFGRTDWEYVINTFVFIAKTGYRFINTKKGAGSLQMVGIGADAVHTGILVEGSVSWLPLLITNGQFTSDRIETDAVGVRINSNPEPAAIGPVRFVNCSFLFPQAVISHSPLFVSFLGCHFNAWGGLSGKPMVEADNGKLQVIGCTFDSNNGSPLKPGLDIILRNGIKSAIISENMGANGVEIINEISDNAIIKDNEEKAKPQPEISVVLTKFPIEHGLLLMVNHPESKCIPVVAGNREAWTSEKEYSGSYFMYFYVDAPDFEFGGAPKVTIEVDYFDETKGSFTIMYDSSDKEVLIVPTMPGAFKNGETYQLNGSGKWKTAKFVIHDALFSKRCNGGDFRLVFQGGSKPVISAVRIKRMGIPTQD